MPKNKYLVLVLLNFLFAGSQYTMGQIKAPSIECIKNITGFSYTPPGGLTLASAKWTFGDGSNATTLSPYYIYKSTGYFTVRIQATFTNNTTVTDSHKIQVVGLPKVSYSYLPKSDSCFTNNNICFKDSSRPAALNQTIIRRLLVWGDGDYNMSYTPGFGDELCHHYKVTDKYLVKMEVIDVYGCKNSQTSYISIIEQSTADFSVTNIFKDCFTKRVCISNRSRGVNANTASYKWITDNTYTDTNKYFTAPKCIDFTSNKTISTKLVLRDKNGCMDSLEQVYFVYIDSFPTKMTLKDTSVCYASGTWNLASVKFVQNDQMVWSLDNQTTTFTGSNTFTFNAKTSGLLPGQHTVKCLIVRGACSTILTHKFTVKGPIAAMKILDNNQCLTNRQVFFVDDSRFIDRKNAIYHWTVKDPYADTCTIHRARNINTYTNCMYALDWYTKHQYTASTNQNPVTLWVKDTVSGCMDEITGYVNLKVCSPLLNNGTFLCPGDVFGKDPLPSDPKFISLDSGKTWKKFPITLDKSLSGKFDIGFIFETILTEWGENTGNDSIRIRLDPKIIYDTVFMSDYLDIQPYKTDSVFFKFYGNCNPFRLSVHFKDGIFYGGETLRIKWDDGSNYDRTFWDTTKVDSVFHIYSGTGFNRLIRVSLLNRNNCETTYALAKKAGKLININNIVPYYCDADTPICFKPSVFDIAKNYPWNSNQGLNTVSWKFSDSSGIINQFAHCHLFTNKGKHTYKMIVNEAGGCSDTLSGSLFIQDLKANVKNTSKEIYCSELKQFFDSSSCLVYKYDSITRYVWDFGTGTFSNPQKDPFKSLNTSAETILVTHAVSTLKGCVDTVRFDLKIVGSHPYFKIRDTIGCDSLGAVFMNLSKNCRGFIWEFGDSGQTSFSTDNKQNAGFNYTKPGRYNIQLYGYDSFYNPSTNAVYFCNSVFPDPLYQKDSIRSVLILPHRTTGIISRDTICLGTKLDLASLSDSAYGYDRWKMGDDSSYIRTSGSKITHKYLKNGTYLVSLYPEYSIPAYNICRDSAFKTITVIGVKADFDLDTKNKAPVFLFHNKSSPGHAMLNWDFGQLASGQNNFSSEQDPSHNYGYDTGNYIVCLRASLPFGCADTVCKNIFNDYLADLMLFNVFTPGNVDDKNDQFDILIEGESYYHLSIFDRWGVLVYEGLEDADNTMKVNWNGRVMNTGNECASGTYYYIFDYKLKTNPENMNTINGVITLIR